MNRRDGRSTVSRDLQSKQVDFSMKVLMRGKIDLTCDSKGFRVLIWQSCHLSSIYQFPSLTPAHQKLGIRCKSFRVEKSLRDSDSNGCPYSISMVPGGLLVKSYSTRHTPSTSFTIRVDTRSKNSQSKRKILAVMKSVVCTARSEITC